MPDKKMICLMCSIYVVALLAPAIAGAAVPDPDVLWWKFDEGTGAVAKDSSGKGHDGVITGATWKDGGVGGTAYCLDFPGTVTPMVQDNTAPTYLNGLGAITVALWVKSRVTNTDNGFIIAETPAGNDSFVTMRYDAAGSSFGGTNVLKMAVTSTPGGEQQLESSSGLQTTQWHHVAMTWKGGDLIRFYTNGKEDTPSGRNGPNNAGTISGCTTLIVGRGGKDVAGNPGNGWNGLIDDVRIYSTVLTAAQIAEIAANKPLTLKATLPNPADGATAVSMPLFQWTKGDTAVFHNVYLGTTADLTAANLVAPNQPFNMFYYTPGLTPGVVNYWRVDEVEADGTIRKGDVWKFSATPKTAWGANPGDGAAYIAPNAVLGWTAGMGATTHDVYFGADRAAVEAGAPETKKATNQAAATFTPTGLERGKTYYWRVDEVLAGGTKVAGSIWSFTVRPVIAKTDPNMVGWWKLDDEKSGSAVDYSGSDNYGTIQGAKWVEGLFGDALQFDGAQWVDLPPALMKSKLGSVTCWVKTTQTTIGMIVYGNAVTSGNGYGDENEMHLAVDTSQARFYIEGGANDTSVRSAAAINNGEWQHLAAVWDATTVVLYVNGAKAGQASNPGNTFAAVGMTRMGRPAASERYYIGLLDDVRLYSRTLSENEIMQTMRGDPLMAWGPQPKLGAGPDIRDATSLSWSAGDKAAKHDVYFGKDKDAVKVADTTSPLYKGRQTGTSLSLSGLVEFGGGAYFWRVDEVEADGTTIHKGTVWSFTIPSYLIVDEFESYNDDLAAKTTIFDTWIDGYADGFKSSGSTVGNEPAPFAERTIVHGGKQAMPMTYDNTKTPFFSEAVQTFAPLQDWTGNGVTDLSLWVRGNPVRFVDKGNGAFTVGASGHDIWDAADDFRFVYKRLSGDGSVTVKVESLVNTNVWAKAGVMIRQSLDADSAMAYMIQSVTNGVSFGWRQTPAGTPGSQTQTGIVAPQWVKLTRTGNAFTAQYSADGKAWTDIKNATGQVVSTNIMMTGSIYIGLCTTSHDAAATTTAQYSGTATTGGVSGAWQVAWIGDDVDRTNDAAGLYVVVEDSTGKTATATHATAVNTATWTEWKIPLSSLTGVNLARVKKLYVGVGDRKSPVVDGSGRIYIDDIRVTKP
jgi:regulation of enolase protein 1 (concanavalin A-like superfamily)